MFSGQMNFWWKLGCRLLYLPWNPWHIVDWHWKANGGFLFLFSPVSSIAVKAWIFASTTKSSSARVSSKQLYTFLRIASCVNWLEHWIPDSPRLHPHPSWINVCTFVMTLLFSCWSFSISSPIKPSIAIVWWLWELDMIVTVLKLSSCYQGNAFSWSYCCFENGTWNYSWFTALFCNRKQASNLFWNGILGISTCITCVWSLQPSFYTLYFCCLDWGRHQCKHTGL